MARLFISGAYNRNGGVRREPMEFYEIALLVLATLLAVLLRVRRIQVRQFHLEQLRNRAAHMDERNKRLHQGPRHRIGGL